MTDGWRSLKFILSTHELARDLDQGAVKMGHSRLFSPSLCASRRARSPGVESTLRAEIRTPPPPPSPPCLSRLFFCVPSTHAGRLRTLRPPRACVLDLVTTHATRW